MIGHGAGPWFAALQVAPVSQGPTCTAPPAISGLAVVGQVLACSTGKWNGNGTISYRRQWTRNSLAIVSATKATYSLSLSDAGATIGCTVTARDTRGSTTISATGARTVSHAAPVTSGTLAAARFIVNSGIQTHEVAGAFTGHALSYSLISPPAGVTISGVGLVSIDTAATGILTDVTIAVSAINSGGRVTSSFKLTVGTVIDWSVAGGPGQITVASAPAVSAPTASGGVGQITITS